MASGSIAISAEPEPRKDLNFELQDLVMLSQAQLSLMPCEACIPNRRQQVELSPAGYTMWEMYLRYWQPFGELLTDMEREGMLVDRCGGLSPS